MAMNTKELYTNLQLLLPYTSHHDQSFPDRLKSALNKYMSWINQLKIGGNHLSPNSIAGISHICKKLQDIVKNTLKGLPSTSFTQLSNLFSSKFKGEEFYIDIKSTLLSIDNLKDFYRIRRFDSTYGKKREDLFHIPIKNRVDVQTQRYSSPGYPCLYLGESIYGCWEEMRRPPMHLCGVAHLQNTHPLHFVNLIIPSENKLKNVSYLKLIPLIIACMIRVENYNAIYKPEYIIPQLLIEWILKHRELNFGESKIKIHGVAYLSSSVNQEFEFPKEKFINYAIPIFNVDSKNKYCKELCKIFKVSDPTTNEYEKLKHNYPLKWYETDGLQEEYAKLCTNYSISDFGNLEVRLKDVTKFPLEYISCKE